jgi:hypothetical protein
VGLGGARPRLTAALTLPRATRPRNTCRTGTLTRRSRRQHEMPDVPRRRGAQSDAARRLPRNVPVSFDGRAANPDSPRSSPSVAAKTASLWLWRSQRRSRSPSAPSHFVQCDRAGRRNVEGSARGASGIVARASQRARTSAGRPSRSAPRTNVAVSPSSSRAADRLCATSLIHGEARHQSDPRERGRSHQPTHATPRPCDRAAGEGDGGSERVRGPGAVPTLPGSATPERSVSGSVPLGRSACVDRDHAPDARASTDSRAAAPPRLRPRPAARPARCRRRAPRR